MSTLTLSLDTVPLNYVLLIRASMNFKTGQAEEALEDFNAVSTQLPVELVQNIYFKVWVLSNRPENEPNFGERAMHNHLVSETPSGNTIKARAIMEALIEHCPGVIPNFMQELNQAGRCPISLNRMGHPTTIFSGYTFDLAQIRQLQCQQLRQGLFQTRCPTTNLTGASQLIPNRALTDVIETTARYEERLYRS